MVDRIGDQIASRKPDKSDSELVGLLLLESESSRESEFGFRLGLEMTPGLRFEFWFRSDRRLGLGLGYKFWSWLRCPISFELS